MLSPGCCSLDSLSEAVPFFSPRPPTPQLRQLYADCI